MEPGTDGVSPHGLVGVVDHVADGNVPGLARGDNVALLDPRELRMTGAAGPRPPALDLLARAGWEDRAGIALARKLIDEAATWDLLDLEPLADPSRVRAHLVQRLAPFGFTVESAP